MGVWDETTGQTKLDDEDRRSNRRARRLFDLRGIIDSIGEEGVRRAYKIVHMDSLSKGSPTHSTRLGAMKQLRQIEGYNLRPYSKMGSNELRQYLDEIAADTERMMEILDECHSYSEDTVNGSFVQGTLELPQRNVPSPRPQFELPLSGEPENNY